MSQRGCRHTTTSTLGERLASALSLPQAIGCEGFQKACWPILPSAARLGSRLQYAGEKVRINPKAAIGGYPALTVRMVVRRLTNLRCWNDETVQVILRTDRTEAEAIV